MKKESLESLADKRFDSFSPDEAALIGGNTRYTITASATFGPNGTDMAVDADIDFIEEAS